ncbi:Y-family DNA polymerase [Kordia algicida OT-1]|uniref:Nucleotidyltransferase/DNA polymerase involved in DNA repair n=1 Tax=Kordia algicida OT-1 TaxID=391587 RepID=A9DV65_9FLAO|nr:Y-family DNA polymerase [Kordia algicida]EDP96380.1 nucleotidyltransferase/DNA polymerase involved in DNA repair [Kordia algicida OT-1]
MYAIIDCNSFYASCERAFDPKLINKPLAILSNNDGCVISRNKEAKALGIPMGAPLFKYKEIIAQKNIQIRSSNYSLYGDMSERVMKLLEKFSPEVEVYSIDEAFIKLPESDDYQQVGLTIKNYIYQCTGIPVSVGIAPTKALAKAANNIVKKFPDKTNGSYAIDTEAKRIKLLKWLPIKDIWGIGRGNTIRLQNRNVQTAYEFTELTDDWVKRNMSIVGLRLKKDLEGEPTIQLEDEIQNKKVIATTRSFEFTFSDKENLKERIATFASRCAEKLREQKCACNIIMVSLKSDKNKKNESQYRANRALTLPFATDSTLSINQFAQKALDEIYKPGIKYKRAGVILTGLVEASALQLDLFKNEDPKHKQLMATMDALNQKYSGRKIKMANQDLQRTWKMRQAYLSPEYTTKFSDIIVLNCRTI